MTEKERGKMRAMENLTRYMAGLIVRKEMDNRVNVQAALSHFINLAKYTTEERKQLGVSDDFVAGYEGFFSVMSEDLDLIRPDPLDPSGFEVLRRFPKN